MAAPTLAAPTLAALWQVAENAARALAWRDPSMTYEAWHAANCQCTKLHNEYLAACTEHNVQPTPSRY